MGNWESEELDVAQNRAANDRDFRPGIDDAKSFRRLVCAIKGIPPGPEDGGPALDDKAADEIIPYLGLNVFDEADARLFFGREADVQ